MKYLHLSIRYAKPTKGGEVVQMNQPTLFYNESSTRLPSDVTIARHRGNAASIDANPAPVTKDAMRAKVLQVIRQKGQTYSKEIARELGVPLNTISGRITELAVLKQIWRFDERQEGCQLIKAR
jgi:hypothetical protein